MALAGHSWIGSDEFQNGKELVVISFGNGCSEVANALFCNGNNILFRLDRNDRIKHVRGLYQLEQWLQQTTRPLNGSQFRF